jgi:hypothetical protein
MARKTSVVKNNKIAWRFADPPRYMRDTSPDAKYTGATEPLFPDVETQMKWTQMEIDRAFRKSCNWYNMVVNSKKATEWATEFVARNPRRKNWVKAANSSDTNLPPTVGFLCRMGRVGFVLRRSHLTYIINNFKRIERQENRKPEAQEIEVKAAPKFNIQDRLQEKYLEAMGELEGRFDEFVAAGCKGEPKAVDILSSFNIHVQKVKDCVELYERKIKFWTWLSTTKDSQYIEAYSRFGKREYNAIIKWFEKVISDAKSFETVKKVNRKVRVKKPDSPEKKVSKLKYLRTYADAVIGKAELKSVDPTQILTASELWVYDTAKRKLGIYVVDPHITKLDVKGSKILGFDATASVQKRLRKPAEQLKAFEAAGKPAAKKWFKGVRSVETTLKGRITEDMILLKAFK